METPAKLAPGSRIPIVARVYPGLLDPKDIRVEAVIARDPGEHIDGREVLELSSTGDGWAEYRGQAVVPESGTFTVSVRAFPYRASLAYPLEVSLVAYA